MIRTLPLATCLLFVAVMLLHCHQDNGPNEPEPDDTATQSISPQGGTYDFPGGITLDVPAGAVGAPCQVTVELLEVPVIDTIVSQTGITDKRLLAAFEMRPIGLSFLEPLEVTVPSLPHSTYGLPYLFTVDTTTRACLPSVTSLVSDPDNGVVTATVAGCSTYAVVDILGVLDSTALTKTLQAAGCRDRRASTQESSRQSMSQQGTDQTCVVSKVDGSITYHDCRLC